MSISNFLEGVLFSFTFPLSVPGRLLFHIVHHLRTEEGHFNRYDVNATNQILHNIVHLTKAPAQLILQTYIMIKEWSHLGGIYRAWHSAIILYHIMELARTLTLHFFFTVSGKYLNATAPVKATLWRFSMQICHIIIRGPILLAVVAILKIGTLVYLFLWVLINWATAKWLLKTDWNKEIYAACAGILAPTAFISRHTLKQRKRSGPNIWKCYTRCNAVLFFLFTTIVCLDLFFGALIRGVVMEWSWFWPWSNNTHRTGTTVFPDTMLFPIALTAVDVGLVWFE